MPHLVESPVIVEAAGNKPKRIEEFFGKAGTKTSGLSLARMASPGGFARWGWSDVPCRIPVPGTGHRVDPPECREWRRRMPMAFKDERNMKA